MFVIVIFNLKCNSISYIWAVYPDYHYVAFTSLPQNTYFDADLGPC